MTVNLDKYRSSTKTPFCGIALLIEGVINNSHKLIE
jgi:hypothetical protein